MHVKVQYCLTTWLQVALCMPHWLQDCHLWQHCLHNHAIILELVFVHTPGKTIMQAPAIIHRLQLRLQ